MRGLDPQPEGGYSKMGVSSNAPKKFFSCSNCGKHFNHKQSLQRHIRRNSDSGSSNVSSCPSTACFCPGKC
uniref:C2H2-type domain-containing protein n=1 Tax=Gouania willdenowi TaxID=441366 RepID=A0A8C5GPZ5_GOUWI